MHLNEHAWRPVEMWSASRDFLVMEKEHGDIHQIKPKKEPVRKNRFTIFLVTESGWKSHGG
jgi:hypothetical protein